MNFEGIMYLLKRSFRVESDPNGADLSILYQARREAIVVNVPHYGTLKQLNLICGIGVICG